MYVENSLEGFTLEEWRTLVGTHITYHDDTSDSMIVDVRFVDGKITLDLENGDVVTAYFLEED